MFVKFFEYPASTIKSFPALYTPIDADARRST